MPSEESDLKISRRILVACIFCIDCTHQYSTHLYLTTVDIDIATITSAEGTTANYKLQFTMHNAPVTVTDNIISILLFTVSNLLSYTWM